MGARSTVDQLDGWYMVEAIIECTKCRAMDGTENSDDASEEFFEGGWRATKESLLLS
jgi:hypothetical protein